MTGWQTKRIGDVALKITKGTTPTTMGRAFTNTGVNFIKVEAISDDGSLITDKFAHIDTETHSTLQRSILNVDDVLFSIAGAIGRTAIVTPEVLPANINQAVALIRPNASLISPKFLALFLQEEMLIQFANSIVAQSVQANINLQQLADLEVPVPALSEQNKIVAVLSSLNDKIRLLRKQNETLEQIGQTIFDEQIVSKAETDLPEGWVTGGLPNIANFLNGIALQKYPATDVKNSLPAIKIKELNSGITDATNRISRDVPEKYIIHDGDILFSWSGSLEVVIWQHGDGALNQHLFKVSSEKYPKWFYYFWLLHHLSDFRSIAENKATTMGHIQRYHLDEAKVLIPDDSTLNELDIIITPTFNKMAANNSQIQKLVVIRDLLLPQLMSGKLKI